MPLGETFPSSQLATAQYSFNLHPFCSTGIQTPGISTAKLYDFGTSRPATPGPANRKTGTQSIFGHGQMSTSLAPEVPPNSHMMLYDNGLELTSSPANNFMDLPFSDIALQTVANGTSSLNASGLQPCSLSPFAGEIEPIIAPGVSYGSMLTSLLGLEKGLQDWLAQGYGSLDWIRAGRSFRAMVDRYPVHVELNNIIEWATAMFADERRKVSARSLAARGRSPDPAHRPRHSPHAALTSIAARGGERHPYWHFRTIYYFEAKLTPARSRDNLDESLGTRNGKENYHVILTCVPAFVRREPGISISFTINMRADPYYRLSPTIRTFNIIPRDSEIFTLIDKQDVDGIRKLFAAGKASPADVSESGSSLIMVKAGCIHVKYC